MRLFCMTVDKKKNRLTAVLTLIQTNQILQIFCVQIDRPKSSILIGCFLTCSLRLPVRFSLAVVVLRDAITGARIYRSQAAVLLVYLKLTRHLSKM